MVDVANMLHSILLCSVLHVLLDAHGRVAEDLSIVLLSHPEEVHVLCLVAGPVLGDRPLIIMASHLTD